MRPFLNRQLKNALFHSPLQSSAILSLMLFCKILMLSAFLTKMSALSLQKIASLGYPCYSRYSSYRKGQDQMDYLGRGCD